MNINEYKISILHFYKNHYLHYTRHTHSVHYSVLLSCLIRLHNIVVVFYFFYGFVYVCKYKSKNVYSETNGYNGLTCLKKRKLTGSVNLNQLDPLYYIHRYCVLVVAQALCDFKTSEILVNMVKGI